MRRFPLYRLRRILFAVALFFGLVIGGGVTFWLIGDGDYALGEALYFTLFTITTVGYSELPNIDAHPSARSVNSALIILGVITIAFFQSTLTALLVEGVLGRVFRRHRMDKRIGALSGHLVVAGCGRTGRYVIDELRAAGKIFVVIDQDDNVLEKLYEDFGGNVLYVVGDATEDAILIEAGVNRASGVIAALTEDRDNLFVTLSARSMNAGARIISKVAEAANEPKMIRAGADTTVSPTRMGGIRMVGEILHPNVLRFFDRVRVAENLHFEEIELRSDSVLVGSCLRDASIRAETNLLVVAVHETNGNYLYNPPADYVLTAGAHLVVMGQPDNVAKLRRLVDSSFHPSLRAARA